MQLDKLDTTQSHVNLDSSYSQIMQEGRILNPNENTIMNIEIDKVKSIIVKTGDVKFKSRIGNVFALWVDKNGDPRIVIGPHCENI